MSEFRYIISIDLGTTFSGSCYTLIGDKKKIVHVIKWPEQSGNDTFEKTPTACLYETNENSSKLIKWGKAAYEHALMNPNDPNLRFIDQFKLKLHSVFIEKNYQSEEWKNNVYIQAAIDYLREIHKYTCEQLMQNDPRATLDQFKYVLTVPATWVDRDTTAMRIIAEKAGIIDETKDSSDKLVILSEAHAAALFCEREYCLASEESKLYKGQRYIACDAGGGTVDVYTFECTTAGGPFTKIDHCQLALESGGASGSTIVDKNLEHYLKDEVFGGCIEDAVLKSLVDQFVKEIKHYFGGDDPNRNNYLGGAEEHYLSKATEKLSLAESTSNNIAVTEADTKMVDVVENDYDYNQDYESCEEEENEEYAMSIADSDIDSELFENSNDDNDFDLSSVDETPSTSNYVYFTLPSTDNDSIIFNHLPSEVSVITHKGSNIKQLRVSHQDIAKHVFDPVVCRVIGLIEQQIKNSHTTIDILFLLGGFGQSPYLYKKIHKEFITEAKGIMRLIVPEDGYRASMRGGIHYGLNSTGSVPLANYYKKKRKWKFNLSPLSLSRSKHQYTLVHKGEPQYRIAQKRYAIHFTKFAGTTPINSQNISFPLTKEEGAVYVESQENLLKLHPVIERYQSLINNGSHKFYVESKCHLSALLYSSEDDQDQDYLISNNSFKKLHRFFIPIRDPLKPVEISYTIGEYSILFTAKQDDYESDHRCDDYAFYVK